MLVLLILVLIIPVVVYYGYTKWLASTTGNGSSTALGTGNSQLVPNHLLKQLNGPAVDCCASVPVGLIKDSIQRDLVMPCKQCRKGIKPNSNRCAELRKKMGSMLIFNRAKQPNLVRPTGRLAEPIYTCDGTFQRW